MDSADLAELVENILMRASEQIGDITPVALRSYYAKHPQALDLFEKLSLGNREHMEGLMIENCLYFLMRWVEDHKEVQMWLDWSVMHHNNTLKVSPELYNDLLDCTAQVIATTIPAENAEELKAWSDIRSQLRAVIDGCSMH